MTDVWTLAAVWPAPLVACTGGREIVRHQSGPWRTVGGGRALGMAAVAFLVWAFLIHWGWEAVHAVAYVETAGPFRARFWHCWPMGAIDAAWSFGLLVGARLIVAAAGRRPRVAIAGVLAALGAATAVILEWHALRTGRWTYNELMPLIPGLGVGVYPVLQMAIVPVVAARVSGFFPTGRTPRVRADGDVSIHSPGRATPRIRTRRCSPR